MIKIKENTFNEGYLMISQSDHRSKGLPANTPYSHCHIIALTYKNNKVQKKISDFNYRYQREASVGFEKLDKQTEAIVLVSLEEEAEVNICYYADQKIKFTVENDFDKMLPYMEALASIEENQKITTQKLFKTWLTSVGQVAFLAFKNITNKPFTMIIEFTAPNNMKLIPDLLKQKLRIEPGSTRCIKGKIQKMSEPYGMGPMSFSTSD